MRHSMRFTAEKVRRVLTLLQQRVYRRRQPLPPLRYRPVDRLDPAWLRETPGGDGWQTVAPFTYWGAPDVNFVLAADFTLPAPLDGAAPAALHLPLGDAGEFCHPEALVYVDGAPLAAVDRRHHEVLLPPALRDGAPHRLLLHGWTGGIFWETGRRLLMGACAAVAVDAPTRDLADLLAAVLEAVTLLPATDPAHSRLLNGLDESVRLLDLREPLADGFYDSVPGALARLRQHVAAAGPPLDVELVAAGHAHIDVAWLWTLSQTRAKARRTFTNVLHLMDQFADFHFTQSQPQLYEYIRQEDPDLFAAIQQRVADGRWEPIGGMWVEADCNITGSESLARQLLLGRRFFRDHFGPEAESPVLWLPDVFGYAWCLPQLLRQAGLDYFFTIKIGWNQVNKMPVDSFWWQGIDGTRVLTHFSTSPSRPWGREEIGPADLLNMATYNAELSPFTVLGSWTALQHKEDQNVLLMSYGFGDGGGGPTREMNVNAALLRDFPALPRVRQGKVIDFFRRLEAESGPGLPVWNSELYLELHRGTYTTQARNKRDHRKNEFLLHDAEFLAALAALRDAACDYPHAPLNEAWQLLCLNQFHDIIPGSSINAVYAESAQQHAAIRRLAEAARDQALGALAPGCGGDLLLVNPTSFARRDLAFWAGELPAGSRFSGETFVQATDGGTLLAAGELPSFSVTPLILEAGTPPAPDPAHYPLHAAPTLLENRFLRVELNAAGDIIRIYDRQRQREVLPPGTVANQFQAFVDRPLKWDAWDIDIFYDDTMYLAEPAASVEVVEAGPLRATLLVRRRILNSDVRQRISLTFNSPRLEFDTVVQWRERHVLLKTAFPVDVLATSATHEIQWGSVQRPTHRNTSWDWARFETAAQKWVDLSEGGYGAALLNDCKYGYDVRDNVIRLSLLRAPTRPDPEADQGEHRFAYAFLPHANAPGAGLTPSAVAAEAYAFNDPLLVAAGTGGAAAAPPPLVVTPDNVIVETVKQAEDGRGIILRLFECNRQRGEVVLRLGFTPAAAEICNLLEEPQETVPVAGRELRLTLRPFQIVTLRLLPA